MEFSCPLGHAFAHLIRPCARGGDRCVAASPLTLSQYLVKMAQPSFAGAAVTATRWPSSCQIGQLLCSLTCPNQIIQGNARQMSLEHAFASVLWIKLYTSKSVCLKICMMRYQVANRWHCWKKCRMDHLELPDAVDGQELPDLNRGKWICGRQKHCPSSGTLEHHFLRFICIF